MIIFCCLLAVYMVLVCLLPAATGRFVRFGCCSLSVTLPFVRHELLRHLFVFVIFNIQ